jgi:hypothetical protein
LCPRVEVHASISPAELAQTALIDRQHRLVSTLLQSSYWLTCLSAAGRLILSTSRILNRYSLRAKYSDPLWSASWHLAESGGSSGFLHSWACAVCAPDACPRVATRGNVQWLVLRESLLTVLFGMVVGIPAAIAFSICEEYAFRSSPGGYHQFCRSVAPDDRGDSCFSVATNASRLAR